MAAVTPREGPNIEDMLGPTTPEHDEVVKLLREAVKRGLSADEKHAQMVSFTMSMLPRKCTLTREQVEEILAKNSWV